MGKTMTFGVGDRVGGRTGVGSGPLLDAVVNAAEGGSKPSLQSAGRTPARQRLCTSGR